MPGFANASLVTSRFSTRIGYEGDAWIRQCVFSNITIFHTDIGIDLISCLPARQDPCSQINAATRIEDILFENITMSDVNRPLFFWMGNETERPYGGAMRRIMLRNIIATAHNGCYLGGCPEAALADVDINGLRLFIDGEAREASPEIPNLWGGSATPFALDCRYAQNVRINDVMIDWTAACGPWQQQIHTEQVSAFHLENLRSRGAAAVTAQPSVHIIHGQDITLQGCRAEAGTEVFAEFTHCEKGITLFGNDFTEARQGISLEATDAAQVVQVAEITRTGTPTR